MKTSIKASLLALIAGTTLMVGAAQAGDGYGDCPHRDGDRGYHHMKGERGYHHMKGGKGHFGMFGLRGLDLTDAQKTEIKALMDQHRSSMSRPDKETRAAHRAEMQALMTSGNFDEAKAKEIIEQRQQVREQHMLERMKLHNQIYNLLTPEQQAKFKERMDRRGERPEPIQD
ncbi:Spy/CpxP family protein refolding chaperone [Shewanella algae]|uniref:Periplasmic heavy metal sensor n=1 Tax=Shewanella algae TaxID=38313 RepID=A0A7T8EFJ4_9GAMM|nr:Spy/CpxP family protein refolding chaperone [Shewanella algae]MBO2622180.1 Spy/CpxP family protein refolding chaperone [Shewanella algae]QQO85453.1 periplasmic heavy metal sensor [Shewanella algae]TVL47714.1 hypothetical protein AYI98_12790 [Shewanella algae]